MTDQRLAITIAGRVDEFEATHRALECGGPGIKPVLSNSRSGAAAAPRIAKRSSEREGVVTRRLVEHQDPACERRSPGNYGEARVIDHEE